MYKIEITCRCGSVVSVREPSYRLALLAADHEFLTHEEAAHKPCNPRNCANVTMCEHGCIGYMPR